MLPFAVLENNANMSGSWCIVVPCLERIPHTRKVITSDKEIVKFELGRGTYLLLFPSRYVEVHAPDEGSVREILLAFRNELFKNGLIT